MSKILIVDDCPDVLVLLDLCISADGHEVLQATNGHQALDLAKKNNPAVIILDVTMPGMNGIEVCKRIRQDSFSVTQPYIIMLSAKSATNDKVTGLDKGSDAYLCKPFVPAELVAQLRVGLRIFEERKNALSDPLTLLLGRRALDVMLPKAVARGNRKGSSLSFAMIDIDHFKAVNDAYGHATGDAVLTAFGGLFTNISRTSDLPFRWGGEEFSWLLFDTDLTGAAIAAERLRAAVKTHVFPSVHKISCSIGIAALSHQESAESLCHRADEALYQAKTNGRDRVEFSKVTPFEDRQSKPT